MANLHDTFQSVKPARSIYVFFENPSVRPRWEPFVPLFDTAWKVEQPVKRKKSRKVVLKHEVDGRFFYVKIYSRRHAEGLEHNLLRSSSLALFRNKAVQHFQLARSLKNAGIQVAEPVMAIERRYGLLRQESMLITPEYLLPPLGQYFKNATDGETYIPALESMIRDIARMHDVGYVQRDPHFNNVLVNDDMSVIWLDFGTVRRFRFSKKKTFRDLQKLFKKTVNVLSGRVSDPEKTAIELLERNYPVRDRLHKALRLL